GLLFTGNGATVACDVQKRGPAARGRAERLLMVSVTRSRCIDLTNFFSQLRRKAHMSDQGVTAKFPTLERARHLPGRRPSRLRPLNIRRPQPARRLRYVGSQARREPNQDYGRDRAPQPRDVENLFKRRRGIRGSRRRGTALRMTLWTNAE